MIPRSIGRLVWRLRSWLRPTPVQQPEEPATAPDGVPRVGKVQFGDLRRLTPVSPYFGYDRGQPVDRYYIESFLAANARDIRGRVLEIGDNHYTRRFGAEKVARSDVLHVKQGNPLATFVGDLTSADQVLPSDAFECVILTQTLQCIFDVRTALRTVHRVLRPGGVLLATVPGISQTTDEEWGDYWCWSFTRESARRLCEEHFPPAAVEVTTHGNVLAAAAFLYGLSSAELQEEELVSNDPGYQLLITIRCVKAGPGGE